MTVVLCAFSFFLKMNIPWGRVCKSAQPPTVFCLPWLFMCVLNACQPTPHEHTPHPPPRSSLPQQTPPFSRCCVFSGNLVMVIEFQIIAMSYVCTICRHVWHAELTGQHTLPGHRTHTSTPATHTHTLQKHIQMQTQHSHRTHMTPAACFSYLRCSPSSSLSLFVPFSLPLSPFVPSSHFHFPLSDHVGVSVCVFVFWVCVWVFLTILFFFFGSLCLFLRWICFRFS